MATAAIDMPKRATRTSFKRRTMIARQLRNLRIAKRLSIADAARKCKVSIWCWQRWERGHASIPTERLADIGEALGTQFSLEINPYLRAAA